MRTPVLIVGALAMLLALSQLVGAQSTKTSPSPRPMSATVDCFEESIETLIELAPTQRFALTDYVVRNRNSATRGTTFGAVHPVTQDRVRKFSIQVPGEAFVHHSFVTPIIFEGAQGHVQVGCSGGLEREMEVSVSGALQ